MPAITSALGPVAVQAAIERRLAVLGQQPRELVDAVAQPGVALAAVGVPGERCLPCCGGHRAHRPRQHAGGGRRQPTQPSSHRRRPVVTLVAGEQLVAAVAGEADRYPAPREPGDQHARNLRGVGERLVVDLRQAPDRAHGILGADVELVVHGAEMPGHGSGPRRLVEGGVVVADREGVDAPAGLGSHQRDHGRGVDPAGKQDPERHVGDHVLPDGAGEHRGEAGQRFAFARPCGPRRGAGANHVDQPPEGPLLEPAVTVQAQDVPRPELAHALEDGLGRRHVVAAHVGGERMAIDPRRPARACRERRELGGEGQHAVLERPVKRLDAEAIAPQHQPPREAVEQREREHPGGARERPLEPPRLDRREQGLGVAGAAEAYAAVLEVAPQLAEIVDLAVAGEHVAAARRDHRLAPGGGQIDDRKAAVAERDAGRGIPPDAGVVGTPVGERRDHRRHGGAQIGARARRADQAGDAAHVRDRSRTAGPGAPSQVSTDARRPGGIASPLSRRSCGRGR